MVAKALLGSAEASDSLFPDELAVHSHQPEVHLEQVLEHTQLPPEVPLALTLVSIDGDEQALSKLWVVTSVSWSPGDSLCLPGLRG